ncbi:hypothetical protein TSOC_003894 [Tetrabaena socialis]|uniref:Succinate dehydrogenase assembly factor 4, mitochondrial n=1 Tax=Tetrabaena socialis TaxID=47790 RepID=A0A2J8AAA3_9CHLO|nr:hypothetical protein TSOC_003894 [Tetrabaena socialis]|eukprot:PNH09454.1 hypothetical protein TSOC_003894 [Tetrabaena socialis]
MQRVGSMLAQGPLSSAEECALQQRRDSSSLAGSSPTPTKTANPIDSFTAGLQSKTEQELFQLIQQERDRKLGGVEEGAEGEEVEEEEFEVPNASTGELFGPRGREPTRYGDWENKGRCIDF